jgi:hypothetical protein
MTRSFQTFADAAAARDRERAQLEECSLTTPPPAGAHA